MAIKWEENLRLGVATIDEQHEAMFSQFALLSRAVQQGSCDTKIKEILDFLVDYTEIHFLEEEKLMALHDYAGLAEQRQQHEIFKAAISTLHEMVANQVPSKEIAIKIDAALVRYTINHVRKLDSQLVEFIKCRTG